jgi:signal-transduction protein with cAMP-binding, CBS, and nucleotidyltransferase domain
MPVDERSRHALYLRLEQVLGHEEATTLMESLPPVGWAEVASKEDVERLAEINRKEHEHLAEIFRKEHEHLAEIFRKENEAQEHRIMAAFRKEFAAQTRTFTFAILGSFLTSTGVAVALARAL